MVLALFRWSFRKQAEGSPNPQPARYLINSNLPFKRIRFCPLSFPVPPCMNLQVANSVELFHSARIKSAWKWGRAQPPQPPSPFPQQFRYFTTDSVFLHISVVESSGTTLARAVAATRRPESGQATVPLVHIQIRPARWTIGTTPFKLIMQSPVTTGRLLCQNHFQYSGTVLSSSHQKLLSLGDFRNLEMLELMKFSLKEFRTTPAVKRFLIPLASKTSWFEVGQWETDTW